MTDLRKCLFDSSRSDCKYLRKMNGEKICGYTPKSQAFQEHHRLDKNGLPMLGTHKNNLRTWKCNYKEKK